MTWKIIISLPWSKSLKQIVWCSFFCNLETDRNFTTKSTKTILERVVAVSIETWDDKALVLGRKIAEKKSKAFFRYKTVFLNHRNLKYFWNYLTSHEKDSYNWIWSSLSIDRDRNSSRKREFWYSAFHQFRQAKFAFSDSILNSIQV